MLIQFKFNNIFSFHQEQIFSMVSAPIRASKSDLSNMLEASKSISPLLLSAAIYGANASGKSNFVKTLNFFLLIINESARFKPEDTILITPFILNSTSKNQPSSFEIIFIMNQITYRYGYELNNKEILKEWLYVKARRESMVFNRMGENFDVNNKYKIIKDLVKKKMIRKNALLLSVAAQFNEQIVLTMFQWFNRFFRISGLDDISYRTYTQSLLKDETYKPKILKLLQNADLGIEDIVLKEFESPSIKISFQMGTPENSKTETGSSILQSLNTVKKVLNSAGEPDGEVEMNFDTQESEGTKKIFHLSGLFFYVIEFGGILLIDEFDAKLHPLLTLRFIEIINNTEINKHGAQLIITTHNTNLLESKIFRRDQIWFTEKNLKGETQLFSLYDFKPRNDSDIEKNYINGRFGAIPYLNNFIDSFQKAE